MSRKKAIQSLGIFFLVMCVLTVFSRSMDSLRVPQVTIGKIQKTVLEYSVSGSGTVESTKEQAVFTVAEMKVASLAVQEGEQVKAGDLLLQVDMDTLREKQKSIQAELETASLTKEAAQEQSKLAKEKQESEIAHAQENYDQAVAGGDQAVAQAQADLDLAYDKLNEFYNSSSDSLEADDSYTQEEQSLLDTVWEMEKALDNAVTQREQSIAAARQALETASLPVQEDNGAQIQQVEMNQKQIQLDKVNTLMEQEGKVYAPVSGTVSSLNVKNGGVTGEEAVLLLAQKQKNFRIRASVGASQEKYVDVGAKAQLTGKDGEKLKNTATVESVAADEEDASLVEVVMSVPAFEVEIGEQVEFEISKESKAYGCCLPLTALYEDDSQYFVYVVDEEDSVLGTVQKARRVDVEVEEKNETMAALKSGVLSEDQQVITESDQEIQGGSRVRLKDS